MKAVMQDFDIKTFLSNIKATKPPYQCPFEKCGKIYKSYIGMRFHLYNYDHINNTGILSAEGDKSARKRGQWQQRQSTGRSPSPTDFMRGKNRESLTYAEAQKMVEFDIDGKIFRININEPLDIIYVNGKNGDVILNGLNGDNGKCDAHLTDAHNSIANSSQLKAGKGRQSNGKSGKPAKGGNKTRKENNSAKSVNNSPSQTPQLQTLRLPEPSFRVIEDYEPPDAPKRHTAYHRYIEKSAEEADDEVEYDMDEEDTAWLDLVNKKRKEEGLQEVPADTFELLMDKLEKESYFQSQNSGKDVGPAIDEDAVCCICNDGECQNSNAILFCDMCNLAVHQECYGVPYIPEGQWLCRRCLQSPSRAVDCVLCPNKGGAFKQTDDNRWSHVVCALWIPEVCFANTVFLEPIDSIDNIPQARWKLSCYICKQRGVGACIQCHKANCYVAFHVTCAQQAGLYMKMEAVKEMTSSGLVTNVRKAAFCDIHTPTDENGTVLSGVYSSGEEDSRFDSKRVQQTKAKFKEKLKKARKTLAEKRSAIPVVSIPTIPIERLTKIASLISIPKRNEFLKRLLGYWTLKRQSRNGVPLLRRLQISHAGLRKDVLKEDDQQQHVELKCLQRLRQDLEKARLLVELLRKREKHKRELLNMTQNTIEFQLNPYRKFLHNLLSRLTEKDINKYFIEPVDVNEVTDYLQFIKHPMDFSTIKRKIDENNYTCFESFETDFELIVNNCTTYNAKDTCYHKAALKLRDQCSNILKEAKKQIIHYNTRTGLHAQPSAFDFIMSNTANTPTEMKSLETKLKELEETLIKAKSSKSGGSRTKRVRSLNAQIAEIKHKINSLKTSQQSSNSLLNYQNLPFVTNSANVNKKAAEKLKQNRMSAKNVNSVSDSDSTDICENQMLNVNNFIDDIESRIANNISDVKSNATNKQNALKRSKESPLKNSSNTTSRTRKAINNNQSNSVLSDNDGQTNTRTNRKRKLNNNDSPSSDMFASPTGLSITNSLADKTLSLRKKNQSSNKSNNSKALMPSFDVSDITDFNNRPNNMFTETAESFAREQANRGQSSQTSANKRRSNKNSGRSNKKQQIVPNSMHLMDSQFTPSIPSQSESFSVYRNLNSPADSDLMSEDSSHTQSSMISSKSSGSTMTSHSSSSASTLTSSRSSRSRSRSRASDADSQENKKNSRRPQSRSSRSDISIENHKIPLQPNDVVWAKCTGFPWYPALIVSPDPPENSANASLIPVPPSYVLVKRPKDEGYDYLVCFFDAKRTWQWLPRNKLEPLGIEDIDKSKLVESKKPVERKRVQIAFEKAIEFVKNLCTEINNGD